MIKKCVINFQSAKCVMQKMSNISTADLTQYQFSPQYFSKLQNLAFCLNFCRDSKKKYFFGHFFYNKNGRSTPICILLLLFLPIFFQILHKCPPKNCLPQACFFFVCIDSSRIKKRKRRRNQLNKWRAIRNSHICTLFAQFLVNGSIFHKHHGANSISKHIFIRYGSNDHPSHQNKLS